MGEVGVDFAKLIVNLLDCAGDVYHSAVGKGLDVPGDGDDGVAWNGHVKGKGLWWEIV